MQQSVINEIKQFIAEANRLSEKSFYQHFLREEVLFSDNSEMENTPTLEQLEAYLLHFRKFVQRNDRVSIYKVDQYVRQICTGQSAVLSQWNHIYTDFQELLGSKALTGKIIEQISNVPALSLLDLFKARTFGDLSHLDPARQAIHKELSKTDVLNGLYRFEYYSFLFEVGEIIVEMADLCTKLINPQPSSIK